MTASCICSTPCSPTTSRMHLPERASSSPQKYSACNSKTHPDKREGRQVSAKWPKLNLQLCFKHLLQSWYWVTAGLYWCYPSVFLSVVCDLCKMWFYKGAAAHNTHTHTHKCIMRLKVIFTVDIITECWHKTTWRAKHRLNFSYCMWFNRAHK